MKPPIRLFFFRSKTGIPNFGDELSPLAVRFATGRDVVHAGHWSCELTAIGSILDRYLTLKGRSNTGFRKRILGRQIAVWGSGLIESHPPSRHNLIALAVRGNQTRQAFHAGNDLPLGDPGLLIGKMIGRQPKIHRIGIVPHYLDKPDPMVSALAKLQGVTIIDVEDDPLEVSKKIASCERVLSSSLHGLIVADAMCIPNHRLSFGNRLKGGDFKFLDYASALGRLEIGAHSLLLPEAALTLANFEADFAYQAAVDGLCTGLEQSLNAAL